MRDKIGTSTIYTTILPHFKELYRVYPRKLSREAKLRLKVLEYYYKKSDKNATRTARYFGVSRNFVYKWVKRCYRWDLSTLESRSRRPKRTRAAKRSWQSRKVKERMKYYRRRRNPGTLLNLT